MEGMQNEHTESGTVGNSTSGWLQKFQGNVDFVRRDEPTHLFVAAVHVDHARNHRLTIPTKRGIAIGGYTYDTVNECYVVRGVEVVDIGVLPASFRIEVRGASSWTSDIPMPEELIRDFLNASQQTMLRKFIKLHDDKCRFDYVQMLGNA